LPTFAYEAAGNDGAIARGVVEAPTRSIAVERILALGRTPTRIVQQSGASVTGSTGTARVLPHWGLANDRLTILRELSTLLRRAVPEIRNPATGYIIPPLS